MSGLNIFSLFLVWLTLGCGLPSSPVNEYLSIQCMDVGAGDAILILTNGGCAIMIDAGPPMCGSDTILRSSGITRLNTIVITHAHADHAGNLRRVAAQAPPEKVVLGYPLPSDLPFHRLVADTLLLDTLRFNAGRHLVLDDPRISFCCLWPDTGFQGKNADEDPDNARSLVFEVRFGESAAMFAADAGFSMESSLLNSGKLRPVTILKAGHHGSAFATSAAWLDALSPAITWIPTGRNAHGHPSPAALKRIEDCGSAIFRTDLHGNMRALFFFNGTVMTGMCGKGGL